MLSVGVCTTRHWQTSSPLVQGLNTCTVALICNLHGSLMCLAYFFNTSSMDVSYNEALADVKSTSVGI